MIQRQNRVYRTLNRLKARFDSTGSPPPSNSEQPLRSELSSIGQLESHAIELAERHEVDLKPGRDLLLPRLAENEAILLKANELLTKAVTANRRITPASEEFLDNFYMIEEQMLMAKLHLPKGYSKELPHMLNGSLPGFPRIYDIAKELVLHSDCRVDANSLKRFIDAYQTRSTLKLGELWAVAIMLRLALIENLRHISLRITQGRVDRNLADRWADQMIKTAEIDRKDLVIAVADLARSDIPLSSAFVTEFARKLEGQGQAMTLPLLWIEERLSETGKSISHMVQEDIQQESADRVSIANSISSFRFLDSMDWRKFVESTSAVEKVLRTDPAGTYGHMDFATRDRYRHTVERIAKRSPFSEEDIAYRAAKLATESARARGTDDRSAHVGFYLIDKGLPQLEGVADLGLSPIDSFNSTLRRFPLLIYIGAIILVTGFIMMAILTYAYSLGSIGWMQALAFILLAVCISSPAVGLVNWLATMFVRPRALPRMDFSKSIPEELRTLVVVPSVLSSPERVGELLEGLEIRYLANRDENLHFGLLTDFVDAREEVMPEDEHLLLVASQGIEALNEKYHEGTFFLFPRMRRLDSKDGIWRGYERKRGIIEELNFLLRGGSENSFSVITGDISILPGIKYVITVDEDTMMPYDSARILVETMAHPLNHPRLDKDKRYVVEGYSILHPRLSLSMNEAGRSRFVKLFGGEPGIDPYTREVSDVYQDIFGEGSFTGKGIYDVDAFSQSLGGRFPENRILSHDLLEGSYARAALVSDVQFYEDYPYHYTSDVSRRHRWIRGDWQIASWLLTRVPGPGGMVMDNPISGLSRWKIFDNLRRSLVPPAQISLLLLAWVALLKPMFWTSILVGAVLALPVLASIRTILSKSEGMYVYKHLNYAGRAIARNLAQVVLSLTFMPFEAYFSLDAVVRTGGRMLFTHKRLLEWNTSSSAKNRGQRNLSGFYRSMWIAPAVAVGLAFYLFFWRQSVLNIALPLLVSWFLAPAVAWWISLPLETFRAELDEDQKIFLRKLSRRTWRFFETFVTPKSHWLPPDNYQENPRSVIADGTSPTNMGLSLLANLTAYDFGYISAGRLIRRNARTLDIMKSLERFHGHFYNWYDIKRLEPMLPRYISTVDSGNLVGHLLTLKQGQLELIEQRILSERAFLGLEDTLALLKDTAIEVAGYEDSSMERIGLLQLSEEIDRLRSEIVSPSENLSAVWQLLGRQAVVAESIVRLFESEKDSDLLWWAKAYRTQLLDHMDDLISLAPWLKLPIWIKEHPIPAETSEEYQPAVTSREGSEHLLDDPILPEIAEDEPGDLPKDQSILQDELLGLDYIPYLGEVPEIADKLVAVIDQISSRFSGEEHKTEWEWLQELRWRTTDAKMRASERIAAIERLSLSCDELAEINYDFLFNKTRRLLSIGYNIENAELDESCYDLLASEARLCSYAAIAQGQLQQEHWFALNRMLTIAGGDFALLSWGGTMFEYLMPLLIMPTYENTLLDQTYISVVKRQIEYGKQRNSPWGISESGYNVVDANQIYQYKAFGVPGLGLKRGLGNDLVVAPYATLMALMVLPAESYSNLKRLADDGYMGDYGLYEAVDFTPSRLPQHQKSAIVQSFMSHHQGMSFLSLAYVLLDRPMQRRFMANPIFQAAELLLQEKIPMAKPFYPHAAEASLSIWRAGMLERKSTMRVLSNPSSAQPIVHILSNGNYNVMITGSGAGVSQWKDIAVTRWHGDVTQDNEGQFFYIRDIENNGVWSAGFQPTRIESKAYQVIFEGSRAEIRSMIKGIDANSEVVVSPEDDVELRTISLTNRSYETRRIELTSYAEVVLTTLAADATHPAFSNLFVETKILDKDHAILCSRRPRSKEENNPWMLHMMASKDAGEDPVSFETDRSQFIGRGRDVSDPAAMNTASLSNSEGPVLDPIVSIRCIVTMEPGETKRVSFITGIAQTEGDAVKLIDKYHDVQMAERARTLSWTHNHMIMQQFNIKDSDIHLYMRLAGAIVYPSSNWRASSGLLLKNQLGQSGLWAFGISGDFPIVLLRITNRSNIDLARQLLKAHAYLQLMGIAVDLVIWNEDSSGYRQEFYDEIMGLISISAANPRDPKQSGGVYVIHEEQISEEAGILMQAVARAIFTDYRGTFEEQLEQERRPPAAVSLLKPEKTVRVESYRPVESLGEDLIFFNGLGGFTKDGREYIIRLGPGEVTPAPWSNVIANPNFGTVISESGSAYTWNENSQQFRLTPWYNDPVSDHSGEALYIRDEKSGTFWSPASMPARGKTLYTCRHGFGYSVFEHKESGIASELWVYVAMDAPVKFCRLVVRNESGTFRQISVTNYIELVLGDLRSKTGVHVVTEIDPRTGALFSRNPFNMDFPERTVFLDVNMKINSFTGDRTEFLGRNGSMKRPAALTRERLSNRVGAKMDPCAALQVKIDLQDGESSEVIFTCGAGQNAEDARNLVRRFRGSAPARAALEQVWGYWNRTLGVVYIETEDKALDVLTNGWLLYQTLACRMWARTGYYQSGGAYGFRDQLQDSMALIYAEPGLFREHLLRCAAHQFVEGDVLHWWHPPLERGVRTHITDDRLWLPLAVHRYVTATGDVGVLKESIHFITGGLLGHEQDSSYDLPSRSAESGSLYEHCVRSIKRSLQFGQHGLPLMGSGDWNDGMNRVGHLGLGESVWNAFFLYDVLTKFKDIAHLSGDPDFAEQCSSEATALREKIRQSGWDGHWYLRAYFDNGDPLGSTANEECQIDSIPQSWAVLSGAGDPERSREAMEEVDRQLVNRNDALIQLLQPPFDKSGLDPGYIKGYPPGVRENGGQYTHAAIWAIMAFAALGEGDRAWELLDLINPVMHGSSPEQIAIYRTEPYVVAADVCALAPNAGRGGWTWYTGSSGWMYRLILESLLGLTLEVDRLRFRPIIPSHWKSFRVHYRYRETFYHITVARGEPAGAVIVDGSLHSDGAIQLIDDRKEHSVEVRMG